MNKIISKKEQTEMLNWIFNNEKCFTKNPLGENRKFLLLKQFNPPSIFLKVKEKILNAENINIWEEENLIGGDMITFNETNGFIHEHTDPTVENKEHLRFNLFLSKPYAGGNPIYNGKILEYEECNYIKYHVNKYLHSSLPVVGQKPRIAISYGILVPSFTLL